MNIGILSMQKIHNYGSFLQAFSLKKQLEERGHTVYFIDIEPGRLICRETMSKTNWLSKFDRYFFKRIENYLLGRKMSAIHINDYKTYLDTDKKLPEDQRFDLVLIGSDEVFNATTPSPWGFTTQLFGNVKNAKRVVTYAASCGSTTYESACEYGIQTELCEAMKHLEHISVRDENSANFVQKILGKTAEINVDPVFISDFDAYIPELPYKRPYMLVYAYANRIQDPLEINAIKTYARKHKLEIICVGMQQRWCSNNIPANAFELLAYVKSAECIVTDTFHGTVFSIKYNKRFVTLIRESNSNKLGGLLKQFCLYDRVVENIPCFQEKLDTEIDYVKANQRILGEQEKAREYLDKVCGVI